MLRSGRKAYKIKIKAAQKNAIICENLQRTVLRDYWADSDVRACYGDLLDLYFPKNNIYFFMILELSKL